MDEQQKIRRIERLWATAFVKAKAASQLLMQLNYLKQKIVHFGRKPNNMSFRNQMLDEIKNQEEVKNFEINFFKKSISPTKADPFAAAKKEIKKKPWFIMMPNNKFRVFWNFVIIILLFYTATFVPFQIAFIHEDYIALTIVDYFTDSLFGIDIIVNFTSAIETPKKEVIVEPK